MQASNKWSTYKTTYERACNLMGTSLSDPSFAKEMECGKKLNFEQLIAMVTEKEDDEALVGFARFEAQ